MWVVLGMGIGFGCGVFYHGILKPEAKPVPAPPASSSEPRAPGSECAHVWTEWTEPEPFANPLGTADMFGRPNGGAITLLQKRRCFLCNMNQTNLS